VSCLFAAVNSGGAFCGLEFQAEGAPPAQMKPPRPAVPGAAAEVLRNQCDF
jgi:hypothetical protein